MSAQPYSTIPSGVKVIVASPNMKDYSDLKIELIDSGATPNQIKAVTENLDKFDGDLHLTEIGFGTNRKLTVKYKETKRRFSDNEIELRRRQNPT